MSVVGTAHGFVLGAGFSAFVSIDNFVRGHWTPAPGESSAVRSITRTALANGANTAMLALAFALGSGSVEALRGGFSNDFANTSAGTFAAALVFYRTEPPRIALRNALGLAAITGVVKTVWLVREGKIGTPKER